MLIKLVLLMPLFKVRSEMHYLGFKGNPPEAEIEEFYFFTAEEAETKVESIEDEDEWCSNYKNEHGHYNRMILKVISDNRLVKMRSYYVL